MIESHEEMKQAQESVFLSRLQLEEALDHLEQKIETGAHRVQQAFDKIKSPVRYAKEHPLNTAALFLVLGFYIGTRISDTEFPSRIH